MDSPLRTPQVGVQTTVLSRDGHDLAAALRTILEIGEDEILRELVAATFGGAELVIEAVETLFEAKLRMPGILRPLQAREFSDGQLRFLCLCAALLSPRPPSLMALNEPETSLHPDVVDSLARLIVHASRSAQLWITTHSDKLAGAIEKHSHIPRVRLTMENGETTIDRSGDRLA